MTDPAPSREWLSCTESVHQFTKICLRPGLRRLLVYVQKMGILDLVS